MNRQSYVFVLQCVNIKVSYNQFPIIPSRFYLLLTLPSIIHPSLLAPLPPFWSSLNIVALAYSCRTTCQASYINPSIRLSPGHIIFSSPVSSPALWRLISNFKTLYLLSARELQRDTSTNGNVDCAQASSDSCFQYKKQAFHKPHSLHTNSNSFLIWDREEKSTFSVVKRFRWWICNWLDTLDYCVLYNNKTSREAQLLWLLRCTWREGRLIGYLLPTVQPFMKSMPQLNVASLLTVAPVERTEKNTHKQINPST